MVRESAGLYRIIVEGGALQSDILVATATSALARGGVEVDGDDYIVKCLNPAGTEVDSGFSVVIYRPLL